MDTKLLKKQVVVYWLYFNVAIFLPYLNVVTEWLDAAPPPASIVMECLWRGLQTVAILISASTSEKIFSYGVGAPPRHFLYQRRILQRISTLETLELPGGGPQASTRPAASPTNKQKKVFGCPRSQHIPTMPKSSLNWQLFRFLTKL